MCVQPEELKKVVARTRELTSKPFGVNINLPFQNPDDILQHIFAEKVAFLQVYFGDFPKERVDAAHAAGVKVLHQVPTSLPLCSTLPLQPIPLIRLGLH
jgi:NAD(P)H-dependent flavin oxidoreductase YrpB (nitropropane dioxygenase family)